MSPFTILQVTMPTTKNNFTQFDSNSLALCRESLVNRTTDLISPSLAFVLVTQAHILLPSFNQFIIIFLSKSTSASPSTLLTNSSSSSSSSPSLSSVIKSHKFKIPYIILTITRLTQSPLESCQDSRLNCVII